MAVLCNDSLICFCCFSKPQDMRCISQGTCPITSLSLASNDLGKKTKAVLLIQDMLKDSRSLTHFDISNNGLGAKQARRIAAGLCG
jgi:Ran GTPase-activating protein (RanGAP) involved in mRNA processing and transport